MAKRFIRRPLALFTGGFTLSALVFSYLPSYLLFFGAAAAGLALISALIPRSRGKGVTVAAAGAAFGLLWCFIFIRLLNAPLTVIADMAAAGEGIFKLPHMIAEAIGASIDAVFHGRLSPFIRAITIGDAADLKADSSVYTPLTISGIAHIVAVSGMHVTFLLSMISPLLQGSRRRAFVALPLLLLFMAVSGFSPSVTRAVVMHSFVLLAPLWKRRSDAITGVFAALLLLLLVNPLSITSVGLQLSFLSTLGLVLFSRRIERVFTDAAERRSTLQRPVIRHVISFVSNSLARTLAALSLSLPLTAYYFGYIAIFAPITNLLTLWAASFSFCGGIIAALLGLVWQPLGIAAAAIASVPTDWIIVVSTLISRIPFAAVYVSNPYILAWLVYLYASIVLLIALGGRLRAGLWTAGGAVVTLVLALLLTYMSPAGALELTVLDVGQGQSIVVTDSGASAVIDCGATYGYDASLAAASHLQANAASPADLLILTHFHADHAGSVPRLLARERFETLVIPDPLLGGTTELEEEIISLAVTLGLDIIVVTETVKITFGNSVITIYPPFGEADENEAGLTVLISDGSWDALITGDMPSSLELLLLEHTQLPDIELFVAGHHGSKYSNSSDLLEDIRPDLVVISVGELNPYGHPSEEALGRFAEVGAEVYRTDISGPITVKSGKTT